MLKNHVTENHPFPSIFPKCPECDFDTKEENLMENHFTGNHPFSSVFLKCSECDFDTKEENSCKHSQQKRINIIKNMSKSYPAVAPVFPFQRSCSGLSQRSQSTDSNPENRRNCHRSGSSYSDSKNQRNLHHSLKEVILVHPKDHVLDSCSPGFSINLNKSSMKIIELMVLLQFQKSMSQKP